MVSMLLQQLGLQSLQWLAMMIGHHDVAMAVVVLMMPTAVLKHGEVSLTIAGRLHLVDPIVAL